MPTYLDTMKGFLPPCFKTAGAGIINTQRQFDLKTPCLPWIRANLLGWEHWHYWYPATTPTILTEPCSLWKVELSMLACGLSPKSAPSEPRGGKKGRRIGGHSWHPGWHWMCKYMHFSKSSGLFFWKFLNTCLLRFFSKLHYLFFLDVVDPTANVEMWAVSLISLFFVGLLFYHAPSRPKTNTNWHCFCKKNVK